ncbi:MAG: hypothetical protein H7321_02105 [Bacteroidia bacterium]|nr:hypothetical protein [Bacteroidia bacterium]
MESRSISEIKKALAKKEVHEVEALCLRLAKYKKENKELLSYLLFESNDETTYITSVQQFIDEQFDVLAYGKSYTLLKQIRKILRIVNKHIKFSGQPSTQLELIIYFCTRLKPILLKYKNNVALYKLYGQQIKKTETILSKLHEDIQYDYLHQIEVIAAGW